MFSGWGSWGKPPLEDEQKPAELIREAMSAVAETENLAAEHRYYAGIALKALLEKWTDDPERGRFVIAHKAHLIADAMVNAKINTDWEKKEACNG